MEEFEKKKELNLLGHLILEIEKYQQEIYNILEKDQKLKLFGKNYDEHIEKIKNTFDMYINSLPFCDPSYYADKDLYRKNIDINFDNLNKKLEIIQSSIKEYLKIWEHFQENWIPLYEKYQKLIKGEDS